jgi:hypothetical protein
MAMKNSRGTILFFLSIRNISNECVVYAFLAFLVFLVFLAFLAFLVFRRSSLNGSGAFPRLFLNR